MTIKKILVPLDGGQRFQSLLETSLAAARRFSAHIEVLYVRPNPRHAVPYATLGMSGRMKKSVVEAARQQAADQSAKARARFERFFAKHSVPIAKRPSRGAIVSASWCEETGSIAEALAGRALYCDAIALTRPGTGSTSAEILETALLETASPVLMFPPTLQQWGATNVAIAWNAKPEAARAVAAAMPCLAAARTVTVLVSSKRLASGKELVEHLAWHNIKTVLRQFDVRSRSVGETLLAESRRLKCDLLVMGGYSHTRARQLLFGGVTRHIMASAEIPVLMAH
ncbi:MAG: universal stress protein [Acidiferrobacterales bacterium]